MGLAGPRPVVLDAGALIAFEKGAARARRPSSFSDSAARGSAGLVSRGARRPETLELAGRLRDEIAEHARGRGEGVDGVLEDRERQAKLHREDGLVDGFG